MRAPRMPTYGQILDSQERFIEHMLEVVGRVDHRQGELDQAREWLAQVKAYMKAHGKRARDSFPMWQNQVIADYATPTTAKGEK